MKGKDLCNQMEDGDHHPARETRCCERPLINPNRLLTNESVLLNETITSFPNKNELLNYTSDYGERIIILAVSERVIK